MPLSTAKAKQWTCDGCGMSVRQIDGSSSALPPTWASSADGRFCLVCQRSLAADAALDAAPAGSSLDDRAKLRRAAVIEFEVRRTPEQSNGSIAKACRSSAAAVARARDRLQLPGATSN